MKLHYLKPLALSLLLFLAACGGGGASAVAAAPSPTVPPTVTTTPPTLSAALKAADASGALPALNRDNTVSGPDTDGNGVRDDIDAYIAALPDTPPQKAALRQESSVLSSAMTVDIANNAALLAVANQMGASAACIYSQYATAIAHKKGLEIEKLTVNTKLRFDAYQRFTSALSGSVWGLPSGNGCAN